MFFVRFFAALAVWSALALSASAHRLNESYVYFQVTDDALTGRIEATLSDLDGLVGLDADGDGTVTEAEFTAQADTVFTFFSDRLFITSDGTDHGVVANGHDFLRTPQGVFAQMHFDIPTLGSTPDAVEVTYLSRFRMATRHTWATA